MENEKSILFFEKMPKYVFNGSRLQRASIVKIQQISRLFVTICILADAFLLINSGKETNLPVLYIGMMIILVACILFIYKSERIYQSELDGTTPLIIKNDLIMIPPRIRFKILRKPNHILKEQISYFEVKRGRGIQFVNENDCVIWESVPMELIIITKAGKKYNLGPKPPNTIIDATGILKENWGAKVIDSGVGMGTGMLYVGDISKEYTYEEIMKKNLFEWQE
jgi:hypothetical protein